VEPAVASHGVACVGGDVAHRPPQLVHVEGGGAAGGDVEVPHDLEARQLLGEARRQLLQERGKELAPPRDRPPAAGEIESLRGHPFQTVDALDDEVRPRPELVRGEARLQQRLGVAADDGHGPAEVVGQHAGHRPQGRHALARDQLFLVEVVLQSQGGAAGDHREDARLRAAERRSSPMALTAEHEGAHGPAARDEGDEGAAAASPRGLDQLAVGDEVVGVGSGDGRGISSGRTDARLAGRDLKDLDAFQLAVPEQQGRAVHLHRGGEGQGQQAGQAFHVRSFEDLVREPLQKVRTRRCRPGV
jgi:hypothetical protein